MNRDTFIHIKLMCTALVTYKDMQKFPIGKLLHIFDYI